MTVLNGRGLLGRRSRRRPPQSARAPTRSRHGRTRSASYRVGAGACAVGDCEDALTTCGYLAHAVNPTSTAIKLTASIADFIVSSSFALGWRGGVQGGCQRQVCVVSTITFIRSNQRVTIRRTHLTAVVSGDEPVDDWRVSPTMTRGGRDRGSGRRSIGSSWTARTRRRDRRDESERARWPDRPRRECDASRALRGSRTAGPDAARSGCPR